MLSDVQHPIGTAKTRPTKAEREAAISRIRNTEILSLLAEISRRLDRLGLYSVSDSDDHDRIPTTAFLRRDILNRIGSAPEMGVNIRSVFDVNNKVIALRARGLCARWAGPNPIGVTAIPISEGERGIRGLSTAEMSSAAMPLNRKDES